MPSPPIPPLSIHQMLVLMLDPRNVLLGLRCSDSLDILGEEHKVAVGTHDLDTLEGPFSYEALPPSGISFVPLKQVKNFKADEVMEFYRSDLKLKKFLHIVENSPVFPIIYDSKRCH
ncbi:phenylalanine--tRNA ligase beta subunit, cytoplasmic-like isoform X2 [Eucalyptus grandis]|uniref:phenylalanine--tRNA ligase beta subunit, cytoplasmic-like isoform X2 n=1 Tax=Eucalyptus grandis TaxID=71139 RepID=UPI00192EBDF7|nr:phenylalanine--tRNA ligase beta subunit, cytoplasmic-like isoform X2 [Eucalyptus grandis]